MTIRALREITYDMWSTAMCPPRDRPSPTATLRPVWDLTQYNPQKNKSQFEIPIA